MTTEPKKSPGHPGTRASQCSQPESASRVAANRPVVLIVDDVQDNLLAFEGVLRRDDFEILTASSGAAALELLLAREVAVAIVDVQMPEMDGFELASLMRGVEKTRYVPIIFVTAGSRDEARVFKGYEIGAVDYLFKPVDEHVLRGKVDVFVSLAKQKMQLREAERMREMYIAVLGHDLRNPLSGIYMTAQLMQRRIEGEDIDDSIERILNNSKRMQRMIEQLLDATRFRNDGRISLTRDSVDLGTLVQQIVGEFQEGAERFQVEMAGDTAGTWDADRLLQILSNLIGNAVRHSPADSPIRIHLNGSEEQTVTFSVHNGGPPIPADLHDVLFEPFRRGDMRRRREEGLGLGLYITRQLVDAHGGAVVFETSEESGTAFSVALPRSARAAEAPEALPSPARSVASATPAVKTTAAAPKSVLIVDDEASARLALADVLEGQGYRVVTAARPSEALEAVRREGPIDLLLSDLRLPEISGDALAQELSLARPGLRVIFMSGLPEAPNTQHLFIQKPIDLDQLMDAIEAALHE